MGLCFLTGEMVDRICHKPMSKPTCIFLVSDHLSASVDSNGSGDSGSGKVDRYESVAGEAGTYAILPL